MDKQYDITEEQIKKLNDNGFVPRIDNERRLYAISFGNKYCGELVYMYHPSKKHDSNFLNWCNDFIIKNIKEYNDAGAYRIFHPKECAEDSDLFIDFIIKVKKEAGLF